MTENANAIQINQQQNAIDFSQRQVELVKSQIMPGATDDELALFLGQCERTGLDPFNRQIYAIKRREKNSTGNWVDKYMPLISIDGMRLISERSGNYAGVDGPYWCGDDGKWRDVWLDKKPPRAAKYGVYRKGFSAPIYAVALYDEYVGKTSQGNVTSMWQKYPTVMLAKCAESLARRQAFPQELSNLYTREEMNVETVVEQINAPNPDRAKTALPRQLEPVETQEDDFVDGNFTEVEEEQEQKTEPLETREQVLNDLPFLTIEEACKQKDSQGKLYCEKTVPALHKIISYLWASLLKNGLDEDARQEQLLKLASARVILAAKEDGSLN